MEKLHDYVQHQLGEGVSRHQIKQTLMNHGWQAQQVDQAFNSLKDNVPIPPNHPKPATNPSTPHTNSSKKQLNPKAVWLFFLEKFIVVLLASLFIPLTLLSLISSDEESSMNYFWIIGFFILFMMINFVIAKLTYKFYKYEIAPEEFRVESGIIWKKYSYIPYIKIQNVDISRGIIDRFLGLSRVKIQTAGYSGGNTGGLSNSEGSLPGLGKITAENARSELIKKARQ